MHCSFAIITFFVGGGGEWVVDIYENILRFSLFVTFPLKTLLLPQHKFGKLKELAEKRAKLFTLTQIDLSIR